MCHPFVLHTIPVLLTHGMCAFDSRLQTVDAIESGAITEWKCPFEPISVVHARVLGTALRRRDAKMTKLDFSYGGIDTEGMVALAGGMRGNRSLRVLK